MGIVGKTMHSTRKMLEFETRYHTWADNCGHDYKHQYNLDDSGDQAVCASVHYDMYDKPKSPTVDGTRDKRKRRLTSANGNSSKLPPRSLSSCTSNFPVCGGTMDHTKSPKNSVFQKAIPSSSVPQPNDFSTARNIGSSQWKTKVTSSSKGSINGSKYNDNGKATPIHSADATETAQMHDYLHRNSMSGQRIHNNVNALKYLTEFSSHHHIANDSFPVTNLYESHFRSPSPPLRRTDQPIHNLIAGSVNVTRLANPIAYGNSNRLNGLDYSNQNACFDDALDEDSNIATSSIGTGPFPANSFPIRSSPSRSIPSESLRLQSLATSYYSQPGGKREHRRVNITRPPPREMNCSTAPRSDSRPISKYPVLRDQGNRSMQHANERVQNYDLKNGLVHTHKLKFSGLHSLKTYLETKGDSCTEYSDSCSIESSTIDELLSRYHPMVAQAESQKQKMSHLDRLNEKNQNQPYFASSFDMVSEISSDEPIDQIESFDSLLKDKRLYSELSTPCGIMENCRMTTKKISEDFACDDGVVDYTVRNTYNDEDYDNDDQRTTGSNKSLLDQIYNDFPGFWKDSTLAMKQIWSSCSIRERDVESITYRIEQARKHMDDYAKKLYNQEQCSSSGIQCRSQDSTPETWQTCFKICI